MDRKVIKTINNHKLINRGEKILVGVSGGADSMALLYILIHLRKKYDIEVAAAHINHMLRSAAYTEAEYVKRFCEENSVPVFVGEYDVKKISETRKVSEEQAGREVRYNFFAEVMNKTGATRLATAHHKNDNAETVMLHLIRGSGMQGLGGIRYEHDNIIRPLLDVTRAEIEEFCERENILYYNDETNFSEQYTRNKLRLVTIPHIEKEYNSNFTDTLSRLAQIATESEDFIRDYSKEIYDNHVKNNSISIAYANGLPNAVLRCVIRYMIESVNKKSENISFTHVDTAFGLIKSGKTGKSADLLNNICAEVEYDVFKIEKKKSQSDFCYKIRLNEKVFIEEAGVYITMISSRNGFKLEDVSEVFVTNRKNGDVFYPEGMTGKKKLKDFFIDMKIPVSARAKMPIIRYKDDILTVGDIRRDRRYLDNSGVSFVFENASEEVFI